MAQPPLNAAPRNTLAVASLALGITGLVLAPLLVGALLGILALILGLAALARGPRKTMAAGGIITGALSFPVALIVAAILLLAGPARDRARETASLTNLRRLDTALLTYAADYKDAAPVRLADLAPYTGDMSRLIRDQRVPGRHPAPLPPAANPAQLQAALDRQADFWFAAAGITLHDPCLITFYDKGAPGTRRLLAFADGHVAAFKHASPELEAAVIANNKARAALQLPPLPLDLDGPPPATAPLAPVQ